MAQSAIENQRSKILVVDDNEQNLYMLQVLLKGHGYQVVLAGDGAEALEKARRDPPDVVISDVLMPVMDGFTLCREWKKDEVLKAIPFVFYTATYINPKDERFALSLGAERFILKPQEPDVFAEMMREVIESYEAGRLVTPREPVEEEEIYLKEYNEALVRKLEDKMVRLEEANRAMELEIAERKRVEERVEHLNAVLRAIRGVNQLIVREKDRDRLLQGACDNLIEARGYYNAWTALLDEAGGLVTTAEAGVGEDFPLMVRQLKRGELPSCAPKALAQSGVVVVKDPALTCADCSLSAKYSGRGGMSIRLEHGEKVYGLLVISMSAHFIADEEERALFKEVAGDIAFALRSMELEDERKRMEEQLRQQERLAAVGQLAGGIAHDFNNLLTTIMLYAQMNLSESKQDLPPNVTRALETILDESRKAAELVQQILDFSRSSPIETHPVDLDPFVKEVVRVLERMIPESISLPLEVKPGRFVVNADPTRIQQVLMNLVVNARDAMPGGGVLRIDLSRVEVSTGEEPPVVQMVPGEWVCLAVSDTGAGILPEVLPHIFEPFFTTKPRERGTGLGLAQVYGIVTQHEGHIGVETRVGQGTTFRVYLPAHQLEEEKVPQEEAALVTPEGKGETILLVEDNGRLREVGREILESLGYRVLTAANGREALEIYRSAEGDCTESSRRIDLVLTDLVMPEMGGRELIQELRKTTPGLKALGITGYMLAEDMRELKEESILNVVYKPFDVNALAQVVRTVLNED